MKGFIPTGKGLKRSAHLSRLTALKYVKADLIPEPGENLECSFRHSKVVLELI